MTTPITRDAPHGRRTLKQQDARTGLALISPTLLIVLAAVVVPLLWSLLIAFQRLRLIQIGTADLFAPLTFTNFRVLSSDQLWSSLGTTLVYTFGAVVLSTGLGLVAALALRKPFRGRSIVRAILLLPYVAPVVAVTFVWRSMLNPQFGIVNQIGQNLLGWSRPISFLSQESGHVSLFGLQITVPTALLTVIVFEGWRYFPFAFLFLTARLGATSSEVEEAARVDGAGPFQSFRYVLLPQLLPVISLLAILRTIWTFNDFDDIFLLTGGAAGTQVASVRMYDLLTVQRNVGAASAQSVVMSVFLIVMLTVYLLILRRRGERA